MNFSVGNDEDLTMMCIGKDTLLELLKMHPKVNEYWMEQARLRAIEFR
jgi:hypothetical protein